MQPTFARQQVWMCLAFLLGASGCSGTRSPGGGGSIVQTAPPEAAGVTGKGTIGAWAQTAPSYDKTYCVRPPGSKYGTGDGSTWSDALSGLPDKLVRGAKYYLASGEYYEAPTAQEYFTHTLNDDDSDGKFIGLVKATATDHGTDAGWQAAFGVEPAQLGPMAIIKGHYIIDGQVGQGTVGQGIRITTRDCSYRLNHPVTEPVTFPWNSHATHVAFQHVEIADCGVREGQGTNSSEDGVYMVNALSNVVLKYSYLHDFWRGAISYFGTDVLMEGNVFERSGNHQEAFTIGLRGSKNAVIHRNLIVNSDKQFIGFSNAEDVIISANLFVSTMPDWGNWAVLGVGKNVIIAGNTFYGIGGLNAGMYPADKVADSNITMVNNLWVSCRTNQIWIGGNHSHNAFFDNLRVDGSKPFSIDHQHDDEPGVQVLDAAPFVNAAAFDFALRAPTAAGKTLEGPYLDVDFAGRPRGADGVWDRGAFEFESQR